MNADPSLALWQSAQSQLQSGDSSAAFATCAALLRLQPQHSGAHLMLSNLHGQRGEHRLATASALRAAQKMGPQSLQHVAGVSLRLITVGEYGAAVELIRKLRPDLPAASSIAEFAQQLSLLEQHEDALRYHESALRQGLDGDWVHYVHGNYLKFMGRMAEAAAAYERSIARNPAYALAHHGLAYLGEGGDVGARVDRLRKLTTNLPAGYRDAAYLHYALFKELESIGDVAGAWSALEAGFREKRLRVDHDARAETDLFDALIRATREGFAPAAQSSGGGAATPLFVLGMPRTGTTLLERVLGGHGKVALCGELNDFRMQYKWSSDHYCLGFFDSRAVELLGNVDYPELGRRYLQHVAWRLPLGASHFTDKNPGNFMMTGLILRALPQARIIHLRRNPMDACFSNLKELFGSNAHPYSYDFQDLATHYHNYSRLMAHWHELAPGRILDVNYEDLVREPEAQAQRLMAFCGLAYNPSQIRVEAHAAPVSTASSAQVRQPIHTRNIGGWRRYAEALAPLQRLLEAAGHGAATAD